MKPILFEWHTFLIYSYPLFLGLSWGLGFQLVKYLWEKMPSLRARGISDFYILISGIFIFSWIGSKVFFLFFSDPQWRHLQSTSFWLGGGFVFYGGLIGGLLFLWLFCKIKKIPSIQVLALMAPALCFAHAIGRIGCLLAGCCYGKETTLPWGLWIHDGHRHPVPLYETILLGVLGVVLMNMILKKKDDFNIVTTYLMGYGVLRFILEYLRGDQIRGVGQWGTTSQLISILAIVGAVALWIYARPTRRKGIRT
ncbi:MAG: prolipoprotein diacylglyceryl transferase family protein [Pseudomonadota bacterium]